MILKSTIQLLRFHFSFFLMPVYWFALSQVKSIGNTHAVLIFIILHLLVYPASNGYNSYMDRDTESIGGIKRPMQPGKQLFGITVSMDIAEAALSFFISIYFTAALILYILASRAYSFRGIRLKKYPIAGYITVIIFQGAVTFFMVTHGASTDMTLNVSVAGMITASLLIEGFYPLTQIYQHRQDKEDQVTTLSMVLGYTGTFIFTAIVYASAMALLAYLLFGAGRQNDFFIIQLFFIPVVLFFFRWFYKVYKNNEQASYINTMRMNLLASVCTNAAFITLFLNQNR